MASKWPKDAVKSDVFDPISFTTLSEIDDDDEETEVLDTTSPMITQAMRDSGNDLNLRRHNSQEESNRRNGFKYIWRHLSSNRGQNVTTFAILCALSGCFSNSIGTYISTQMSSLQKHFGFSSAESGFITGCNDLGFFFGILLATQFVRNSHIPRLLTKVTIVFGIAISGVGMAYFFRPITGYSNSTFSPHGPNQAVLCRQKGNLANSVGVSEQECELISQENWKRRYSVSFIFIVFMVIQGICKAQPSSLVPIFIDNNVTKRARSGIYFVLLFGVSMIGPALMFFLGAFIYKIPVDSSVREIVMGDPGWIGAWWLGFIIIGAMSVLIILPLVCFPRDIPKETLKIGRHAAGFDAGVESFIAKSLKSIELKSPPPFKKKIRDFFSSVARVLKKPVYTTILISDCILLFSLTGLWTFLPKYMEDQFRIHPWRANLILAVVTILSSAIGLSLGGILAYRLKLRPQKLIQVKLCCLLLCVCLEIPRLFSHCEQTDVQNNPFDTRSYNSSAFHSFTDCGCDPNKYFPICGINGINYFSPCHAGCINWNDHHFSDCSAIRGRKSRVGLCQRQCNYFNYFLVLTFLLNLVKSVDIIPSYIVVMRSQNEKDKQLGIAIFSAALSLIAFLPGSISFGYLVDSACYLWDMTCGVRGYCKLYQLGKLHKLLFGTLLTSRVGALVFCCISLICAFKMRGRSNIAHTNLHGEDRSNEI